MNFISRIGGMEEHVELKYCERCGGLFLRPPGVNVVYCEGCACRMAAEPDLTGVMPGQRRKSRPARLARGPKAGERELQGMAKVEYLQAVAKGEVMSCRAFSKARARAGASWDRGSCRLQ